MANRQTALQSIQSLSSSRIELPAQIIVQSRTPVGADLRGWMNKPHLWMPCYSATQTGFPIGVWRGERGVRILSSKNGCT